MKICFICNLNLPIDSNALQYRALDWALLDAVKKHADLLAFYFLPQGESALNLALERVKRSEISYVDLSKSDLSAFGVSLDNPKRLCALDPTVATGENPCIAYYDTNTNSIKKTYYFCALGNDFMRYLGINCIDFKKDISFAIENNLKCLQLNASSIYGCDNNLATLINEWRLNGGVNLTINLPAIDFKDGKFTVDENFINALNLTKKLNANGVVLPVTEHVTFNRFESFSKMVAQCFNGFEKHFTLSVELSPNAKNFYTVDDFSHLLRLLKRDCSNVVGFNYDVGLNLGFSEYLTCLGKDVCGYKLYQIKRANGKDFKSAVTNVYDGEICFSNILRLWAEDEIAHAPVILDYDRLDDCALTFNTFKNFKPDKIIDLHSHTYYSNCGRDNPRDVIKTAITNGVDVLGITDHSYGIGSRKKEYIKEMRDLAREFEDKINVLCGIEIPTYPHLFYYELLSQINDFDYCLIEHATVDESVIGADFFGFIKKVPIPCGIAHTDLFAYCDKYGYDYKQFFTKMAKEDVFWEMNVSYDSVHNYNEHSYVKDFIKSPEKLKVIRDSGVTVSVGFDGHRHEDYDGFIVYQMNKFLIDNGVNTMRFNKKLKDKIYK